jgi:hypothetical protein
MRPIGDLEGDSLNQEIVTEPAPRSPVSKVRSENAHALFKRIASRPQQWGAAE